MSTVKANDLMKVDGGIPTVKGQKLIPTAWVNFNGSGAVAIRDSENVSSITDNGTGMYTVNFATTLNDINYTSVGMAGATTNDQASVYQPISGHAPTTTSCRYHTLYAHGALYDTYFVGITIMGGQA